MKIENHLKQAKKLAVFLDSKFNIFGIKFGLDPILDIAPGIGSVISALISCYILWIAYNLRATWIVYIKMTFNILIDLIIGGIPFVGAIIDIFYKSNLKNISILEKYMATNSKLG